MSDFPTSNIIDQIKAEAREEARTEFIKTLLSIGLAPSTISDFGLGTPTQITQILNVHLGGKVHTPEDDEIAALGRKLVRKAIAEADMLMDIGPMNVKLSLIQAALRPVNKMIGNDEGNSHDAAFAAVEAIMAAQRQINTDS